MIITVMDLHEDEHTYTLDNFNLTLREAADKFNNGLMVVTKVKDYEIEEVGDRTNEDARQYLDQEGTGYAVQHYISGKEFSDSETRRLWNKATNALNDLEKYLGVRN